VVSKDEVMSSLKDVIDPELHISIVNLQMVKNVQVEGGKVKVLVALTVDGCPLSKTISTDIEKAVMKLSGVKAVDVETTVMTKQELEQLRGKIQAQMAAAQNQKSGSAMPPGINRLERKGIRNVVAIMSGKGGVGKSFVTAFLAVQLTRLGYKVGILDADITGPSIAKMFGLKGPLFVTPEKRVLPAVTKLGIKVVSMNLILEEPQMPVIVRGPIINSVIRQMFQDIEWGDLHFLLVDLPPGCVTADTDVYANSKPVKITELKPGDKIYSLKAQINRRRRGNVLTATIQRRRVLEVTPQGEAEVFELRTHSRRIKATFNHPVLAVTKTRAIGQKDWNYSLSWRKLGDLRPRDIIAVAKTLPEIRSGPLQLPSISLKGAKPVRLPTKSGDELARLVGYFLGDGFLRITPKTRTYHLMFAEARTGRYRPYYIRMLKKIFGNVAVYEDDHKFGLISHPVVELFRQLGLHKHALDKRLPIWVFELPNSQRRALIEGFCDADGYRRAAKPKFRRAGWMVFESPNRLLMEDLRTLCIMSGLGVMNIYSRTRTLRPPSGYTYTTTFWSFEASSNPRRYGAGLIRGATGLGLQNDYVGFESVSRITPLGQHEVYDLKVEGNENFIADGIIVHNTSDAPLTVFQSLPLQGVIIVTTPQDLALMVVNKAINMAKTLSEQLAPVKLLGLVENMSYAVCPHCGEKLEIFGHSKGAEAAKKAGIPYLGAVPIDPEIARLGDEGKIEDYSNPLFEEVTRAVRLNAARLLEPIPGAMPIAWSEQKPGLKRTD
jgi:ATP-binding protein involved in chromosome partitioning